MLRRLWSSIVRWVRWVMNFWKRRKQARGSGITILVPFNPTKDSQRTSVWRWLFSYWEKALPEAQILVGHHDGTPFSKTSAVNNAARFAKGDIIVILDADAYLDSEIIVRSANEIREARKRKQKLWFIPYRHLYRINKVATATVLASDPYHPYQFPAPPPQRDLDAEHGDSPEYGHHFAALVMVMPREAFEEVGGMDRRFVGWGGEDICFMRAVDTIYGPHKTQADSVFHLYHDKILIGRGLRQWEGQDRPTFIDLGNRYGAAVGDRKRMLALVNEDR